MMERNPRYHRHYDLDGFGIDAQRKLEKSRVLVIGAGGLGCPVLQYLVAAGVGKIGIADGDVVALSNLQRQVLFATPDIGKPKAAVAKTRLSLLNPEIEIVAFEAFITTNNAIEIFGGFDIVIDCTDNFAARYLINDLCDLLGKPSVFGAVYRFEGQVAVFNLPDGNGIAVNYRDLFPNPPKASEIPDCNEAGVLGVLPGTIGTIMANEAIKIACNLGTDLRNRLLTFDLRRYDSLVVGVSKHPEPEQTRPKTLSDFQNTDYRWLCGETVDGISEILPEDIKRALQESGTIAIDVRERGELPEPDFAHVQLPLSQLQAHIPEISGTNLIVFCQSGKRGLEAADLLRSALGDRIGISNLKGGMIAYTEYYGQKN